MLGLGSRTRVFVYAQPADMRKSFFTLAELVTRAMEQDPLSGDAFVFVNRRRTMAKCLIYDGTGMCLTIKRLAVIDIDREKDRDALRAVAKIQDEELRRLHGQVLALKRENEALKGATPAEIDAKIAAFEKQLTEGYGQTRSNGGSERRPRGDKPTKPKKPQTSSKTSSCACMPTCSTRNSCSPTSRGGHCSV